MTPEQAREKLGFHSGRDTRIDDPRWQNGFLRSLRPYSGTLNTEAMDDIVACIRCVAETLEADPLPRDLIDDLWGICHLGRVWAVMEGGMLQSNKLITAEDTHKLDMWLINVSYAVLSLLDGSPESARDALADAEKRTKT